MKKSNFSYFHLLVLTTIFTVFVVTTADDKDLKNVSEVKTSGSHVANGRAIKDNQNNSIEKAKQKANKDSIRKEKDMYDVMRLHQINNNNIYDQEQKAEQEKKEKGKLQTVGGVFGEIMAVIVSEVVKLFGNMVSDVAREVTAHGFVSVFKQFTDLTGISIPENII